MIDPHSSPPRTAPTSFSSIRHRIPVGPTATRTAMCHLAGACITQVCGRGWPPHARRVLASLPAPRLVSSPPPVRRPPSRSRSRSPPPSSGRPAPADQDPSKLRNQNLGMVADTESSDSLPGSSNSAAEKRVDGCPSQRSQERTPKKNHKAEREKLKRDQLNDLFVELSSMLDHDRQNNGKATVLGDAARVLRDLATQVESLRKEQSALLTERQYVGSEKNELQDENATLKAQILELQNELCARMRNNSLNPSSLGMPHPIGSSSANLATQPTRHHIWSNASNLSIQPMAHPTSTPSPQQNQRHRSVGSGEVASRPQELQLFPGTSASRDQEPSRRRSNPATSSHAVSLRGQLCLSLPRASQEDSRSSGSPRNRK